ncbi:hypothetical protein [Burkholderia sp. Bp8998]|uniref:hypothetical protein n=1 Tax=Burkholderia sp. Bp8998 TaxID=2184557 RepID=UPI000F593B71|nr:hypothetical protein [Burkholderia sp. Bp8998]RQS20712.1 hypothetical protein DIE06_09125 [Burkholderia sp. Bp8998]
MSNSSTLLDTLSATSSTKEATLNALFDAVSPLMLWGRRAATTGGLVWGYYGGTYMNPEGMVQSIPDGTLTLAASATNYIFADPVTGVVSSNTSGFPAASFPLYQVVTGTLTASSYTDVRSYQPNAISGSLRGAVNEGAGSRLVDTSASTAANLVVKTLAAAGNFSITDNGAGGLVLTCPGGSITGASNEGSGAPILDVANSTAQTLAFKSLTGGANLQVIDGGNLGVGLSLAGTLGAVEQAGSIKAVAPGSLNFTNASVTATGSSATITPNSSHGVTDAVPQLSGFTQRNQGATGAIATQYPWGIGIVTPHSSSAQAFVLTQPIPSGAFQVTMRLRAAPLNANYGCVGPCLYDSASGKLKLFELAYQNQLGYWVGNFSNFSSWAGNPFSTNIGAVPEWMRIHSDATNWYYEVSGDGSSWQSLFSEAINSFLTPDSCGFYAFQPQAAPDLALAVFSYYCGS